MNMYDRVKKYKKEMELLKEAMGFMPSEELLDKIKDYKYTIMILEINLCYEYQGVKHAKK